MEHIIFTQLSVREVRQIIREEFVGVFRSLPEEAKTEILAGPIDKPVRSTRKGKASKKSHDQKEVVNG